MIRKEINNLKETWKADPIYDLYQGYEDEPFYEELKLYQEKTELEHKLNRLEKSIEQSEKLGITVKQYKDLNSLLLSKDRHTRNAKNMLLHYFDLAGVVNNSDNRAEISSVIDSIEDLIKILIGIELIKK